MGWGVGCGLGLGSGLELGLGLGSGLEVGSGLGSGLVSGLGRQRDLGHQPAGLARLLDNEADARRRVRERRGAHAPPLLVKEPPPAHSVLGRREIATSRLLTVVLSAPQAVGSQVGGRVGDPLSRVGGGLGGGGVDRGGGGGGRRRAVRAGPAGGWDLVDLMDDVAREELGPGEGEGDAQEGAQTGRPCSRRGSHV